MAEVLNPDDPAGLMPRETGAETIQPIAISEDNTIGREPASKTVRLADEANTPENDIYGLPDSIELFADSVGKSFTSGDNVAYEIFKRFEREAIAPPPDPNDDGGEGYIKRHRDLIPAHLEKQFRLAGSDAERDIIRADMQDELTKQDILARRGGFSTFVASGLAGIVDVDTVFALGTGGLGAGVKGGIQATKWGRMTAGALSGGVSQIAMETVAVNAGTTGDWTSIPAAALGGMAFGALGGLGRGTPSEAPRAGDSSADGIARRKAERAATMADDAVEDNANAAIRSTLEEFDEYVADGAPLASRDIRAESHMDEDVYGSTRAHDAEIAAKEEAAKTADKYISKDGGKPEVFDMDEIDVAPDSLGSSVGAAQVNPTPGVASIASARTSQIIQDAQASLRQTGAADDYFARDSDLARSGKIGDAANKSANRFHDAVRNSPIATDFDRLMRSGSAVAQKLAYDLMESSAGIVRNNRSAAVIKDWYEKRLLGTFMPSYEDGFKMYARQNGISWLEAIGPKHREAFNREVIRELNARAFDGPNATRSIPDSVRLVADAHDRWSATDIEIGKGRPGQTSVRGYENLQAYSGYYTQKWSSQNIEKLIRTRTAQGHNNAAEDITNAIAEAYRHKHGFNARDAKIWAAAITRRARSQAEGTDMNLIGILQQDGREFLADVLKQNGISDAAANRLIDKLTGEAATRGQAGHTKGRIDVDLRFTASNGINMLDLVDTDLARNVARRARGTSGAAALARKGIPSRTDRAEIKAAILAEQQARGRQPTTGSRVQDYLDDDKHLTGQDIDDLFSYFDSGPIAGGMSPMYGNAKKLTGLALLNGLGLTNMAELGVQISAVGMKRWMEHAGPALREAMGDPASPLVRELRHMSVLVPEERLFRDDFNLEMDRMGPASSELAQKATQWLNTGQRIQGYVSGFYAVRNFQQRVAVSSAADKIMQNMKGLANDLSGARAADIGLDSATFARVKQYVDNGTVEFKDGALHKLNFQKWEPEDVEDFALSLNRHVNQVVQKAMIGESSLLFHRDGLASLFFHLKSFPMLAMEKQAFRNARLADPEARMMFFAGLVTAGAAYGARQAVNGTPENLTIDKVTRGAIGYSNMTGWIPMWTDPVAAMLGMDSLKLNQYAHGIDQNVFGVPAAFPTLNKMANIPGAALNFAAGNYDNNDIRAMQATPILGNAYGITAILNGLKE